MGWIDFLEEKFVLVVTKSIVIGRQAAAFKHLALEKREKLDMYGELLFALEKCDCQPCKFSVTAKMKFWEWNFFWWKKFSKLSHNYQNDEPRVHMLLEWWLSLSYTRVFWFFETRLLKFVQYKVSKVWLLKIGTSKNITIGSWQSTAE